MERSIRPRVEQVRSRATLPECRRDRPEAAVLAAQVLPIQSVHAEKGPEEIGVYAPESRWGGLGRARLRLAMEFGSILRTRHVGGGAAGMGVLISSNHPVAAQHRRSCESVKQYGKAQCAKSSVPPASTKKRDDRLERLAACHELEGQIVELKAAIKKEPQFNRQVELNTKIKKLQEELGERIAEL